MQLFIFTRGLQFREHFVTLIISRTRTSASTRLSHRTTVSAPTPPSFWREKRDAVVSLVRGFAKMSSSQNKSPTR